MIYPKLEIVPDKKSWSTPSSFNLQHVWQNLKKMQSFQRNVQFEWGLHECAHVCVCVNETGAFTRKKKKGS